MKAKWILFAKYLRPGQSKFYVQNLKHILIFEDDLKKTSKGFFDFSYEMAIFRTGLF